jgi:hypothetical protein
MDVLGTLYRILFIFDEVSEMFGFSPSDALCKPSNLLGPESLTYNVS